MTITKYDYEDAILMHENVPAGVGVPDGYNHTKYAPKEEGTYSLYQVYDKRHNTHIRFVWVKE